MKFRPLSIVPYYGGKSKMAFFIADMLDYEESTTYCELFGGVCSTLLNKSRHQKEIYCEYSDCMRALVSILSDPDQVMELIERLHETDFSEECFNEQLQVKYESENIGGIEHYGCLNDSFRHFDDLFGLGLQDELNHQFESVLIYLHEGDYDCKYRLIENEMTEESNGKRDILNNRNYQDKLNSLLEDHELNFDSEIEDIKKRIVELEDGKGKVALDLEEMKLRLDNFNLFITVYTKRLKELYDWTVREEIEIELEYRKKWHNNLSKLNQDYIKEFNEKRVKRDIAISQYKNYFLLLTNSEEDDIFIQADPPHSEMQMAVAAYIVYAQSRDGMGKSFRKKAKITQDFYHKRINSLVDVAKRLNGVEVDGERNSLRRFALSMSGKPEYMIYCDPPYLMDKDVAIERLNFYDPGRIYTMSWDISKHTLFLSVARRAKCKMLISNYDDVNHLYDRFLVGWKKIEYETSTSISGKRRPRKECLWYNF